MRRIAGHEYLIANQHVRIDTSHSVTLAGPIDEVRADGVMIFDGDLFRFVAWPDIVQVEPGWTVQPRSVRQPTVADYLSDLTECVEGIEGRVGDLANALDRIEDHVKTAVHALLSAQPAGTGNVTALLAVMHGPIGQLCQICQRTIQPWHRDPQPVDDHAGWWAHAPGTCPDVRPLDAAGRPCARCSQPFAPDDLVEPGGLGTGLLTHDAPCGPCSACTWPIRAGEPVHAMPGGPRRWAHQQCPFTVCDTDTNTSCSTCGEPLQEGEDAQALTVGGLTRTVHLAVGCWLEAFVGGDR